MALSSGISVIICTWNRAGSLRVTLESLQEQRCSDEFDVEIIVVDNNSTDNTKLVVQELSLIWKLGELRYIFEPKQGKQFALNRGVNVSRKSIIAFTDDDILFPLNWIENINKVFADPLIELAGGKTHILWPDSGAPPWYHDSMLAILAGVDLGDDRLRPPPLEYSPAGSNLIARRNLFDKVGGYSELHFRHMDYEFGMRCAYAGVQISYEPSLLVFAPVDGACLTKRYFRRWSFKAGIASDYNGNNPAIATFLFVPRWLYRQLIGDMFFLVSHLLLLDHALVFSRELRFWRAFGAISSRWYSKFRPKKYSKWVEKYSQKNSNLY